MKNGEIYEKRKMRELKGFRFELSFEGRDKEKRGQ